MEEEKCFRCERSSSQAKLLDAVYENDIVKICEECSLLENIPVIRKPSSEQLNESEKPFTLRERMRRMARIEDKPEKHLPSLDSLRKPKDYRQILEEKHQLAKKRNIPLNLIDNFNWHILMARKKRKMTRSQLANAISESETAIRMIEEKEMPDDALLMINKIEQFFGIKLKKESEQEVKIKNFVQKISSGSSFPIKQAEQAIEKPFRVLRFDPETAKNLTIADLVRIKKEKEKVLEKTRVSKLNNESESIQNISDLIWNAGKKEEKSNKEIVGTEIKFEEEY